jgi:hypothetical protein
MSLANFFSRPANSPRKLEKFVESSAVILVSIVVFALSTGVTLLKGNGVEYDDDLLVKYSQPQSARSSICEELGRICTSRATRTGARCANSHEGQVSAARPPSLFWLT